MTAPALDLSYDTVLVAELARWTLLADDGAPTGETWWDRLTTIRLTRTTEPWSPVAASPISVNGPPSYTFTPVETERDTRWRVLAHVRGQSIDVAVHPVGVELWVRTDRGGVDETWTVTIPRLHTDLWPTFRVVGPPDKPRAAFWWCRGVDVPEDAALSFEDREAAMRDYGATW